MPVKEDFFLEDAEDLYGSLQTIHFILIELVFHSIEKPLLLSSLIVDLFF